MNRAPIVVLKLGGSVLVNDGALRLAVAEIDRHVRAGERVVAVVSAQAGTTDGLVERARRIASRPSSGLFAAYLATGETRSAAALALAADAARISTALVDCRQLALEVDGPGAEPVALRSNLLRESLEGHALVVAPGFVGVARSGTLRLLGRGGSDLTAIFLAHEIGADRCVLVKDVDGWFTEDPRSRATARRYRTLHWDDAVARPSPVVQDRAVRRARSTATPFDVRTWGSDGGTRVGPEPTSLGTAGIRRSPDRPLHRVGAENGAETAAREVGA